MSQSRTLIRVLLKYPGTADFYSNIITTLRRWVIVGSVPPHNISCCSLSQMSSRYNKHWRGHKIFHPRLKSHQRKVWFERWQLFISCWKWQSPFWFEEMGFIRRKKEIAAFHLLSEKCQQRRPEKGDDMMETEKRKIGVSEILIAVVHSGHFGKKNV